MSLCRRVEKWRRRRRKRGGKERRLRSFHTFPVNGERLAERERWKLGFGELRGGEEVETEQRKRRKKKEETEEAFQVFGKNNQ